MKLVFERTSLWCIKLPFPVHLVEEPRGWGGAGGWHLKVTRYCCRQISTSESLAGHTRHLESEEPGTGIRQNVGLERRPGSHSAGPSPHPLWTPTMPVGQALFEPASVLRGRVPDQQVLPCPHERPPW